MAHAVSTVDAPKPWSGGDAPFNISWGKMMMWFFLVSDALTFSSLLIYYGATRNMNREFWPNPDEVYNHFPFVEGHIPLAFVSLMTFILIMSSVTMVLAVEAGHRFDKKGVVKWMYWTVIGGFLFLGSQAYEWYHFIHGTAEGKVIEHGLGVIHGANMIENEYGPKQFANLFFLITGFHGSHVFSGVLLNIIVLIMAARGVFHRRGHYEMVEKVGLYWHFVDLVWVFVFTFFYLI
ncbi:MAG: cytochrome c oxidase subunit 3 [Bacteroidia bacterium]|jgi:cytochrome c oxidase subunit 3